jgi:hypothetical protein
VPLAGVVSAMACASADQAGAGAAPDRAPAGLGREDAEAVLGACTMTSGAAFGPPFLFVGLCDSPLSLLAMHAARRRPGPGPHRGARGITEENDAVRYRFAQLQNGGFGCLVCGLFCGSIHETSVNSLIYNWLLAEEASAALDFGFGKNGRAVIGADAKELKSKALAPHRENAFELVQGVNLEKLDGGTHAPLPAATSMGV